MIQVALCGVALVVGVGASRASDSVGRATGGVIAWGCGENFDFAQCVVPAAAKSGVAAIAASTAQSIALKRDGSVIAWGCLNTPDSVGGAEHKQCRVPRYAAL